MNSSKELGGATVEPAAVSGATPKSAASRRALDILRQMLGNMAFNYGQASQPPELKGLCGTLTEMEDIARQALAASADDPAVIPSRLAELGDYIDCLSEWDCTDPHEQAVEIRKFLADPEYGIDHLREKGPEADYRPDGAKLHAEAVSAVESYEEWTHYDETLWDAYSEHLPGIEHSIRRRKLATVALRAIEACPVTLPADGASARQAPDASQANDPNDQKSGAS